MSFRVAPWRAGIFFLISSFLSVFAALSLAPAWAAGASAPDGLGKIESWSMDLPTDGARGDIQTRVTAPTLGDHLPILLFSHGAGYSKDDYGPLVDEWAARGFVVMQPSHLDSKALKLAVDDPRRATIWRSRRDDLVYLLDHVSDIERAAPRLRGRMDVNRVFVAGHSYGGHTAALVMGARVIDPATGASVDLGDPRIQAGVLIAPPGHYDDLPADWKARAPYLRVDWSTLRRPVLVIVGGADISEMNPRDYLWRAEAYQRAPVGAACRLTIDGVGHFLGGIGGGPTDSADSRPAAVRTVRATSLDWLILDSPLSRERGAIVRHDVHSPDQLICK